MFWLRRWSIMKKTWLYLVKVYTPSVLSLRRVCTPRTTWLEKSIKILYPGVMVYSRIYKHAENYQHKNHTKWKLFPLQFTQALYMCRQSMVCIKGWAKNTGRFTSYSLTYSSLTFSDMISTGYPDKGLTTPGGFYIFSRLQMAQPKTLSVLWDGNHGDIVYNQNPYPGNTLHKQIYVEASPLFLSSLILIGAFYTFNTFTVL